jgi:hypothetical protein
VPREIDEGYSDEPPRSRGRGREDEYDDDPGERRPNIPNYLVQSILVTLCCGCGLPFGIVAIVNAAQVNSKLSAGDIAGARRASDSAKMWSWIGFGVGIVTQLIAVGIQVAVGGLAGARAR